MTSLPDYRQFISSGARHCILHLDPVALSCDLFIRLDNEASLPCACRGNFSLNQKTEGAVPRMATWHKCQVMGGAANLLAIKELAKLGQKGRELNKIALYYKDLHMWKTIETTSHPLKP